MPNPDPIDLAAFAGDVQKMAQTGEFDPFAMFAQSMAFHSVFLAPFSPTIARARDQFLVDGTGPLASSVETFRRQGMAPTEATESARRMFQQAVGMCVVVTSGGTALGTIPQLFFGSFDPGWRVHAVQACGELVGKEELVAALQLLEVKARAGITWPKLFAGPQADSDELAYWLEIASGVVSSLDDGMMPVASDHLADLGHWTGFALRLIAQPLDADDRVALARCHLVAGDIEAAGLVIQSIAKDELDEEDLLDLIQRFCESAARTGKPSEGATWLSAHLAQLESIMGRNYDVTLALFKLQAAAQLSAEDLLSTAKLMLERDRKSFRHDLTREPLWAVRIADPGEMLDTAAAATVVGRSPTFIAKRMEAGTIPTYRRSDQVRIPARALQAWKAVMDAHSLLD